MVIPAIEMETSRGRLKNAAYLQCNYVLSYPKWGQCQGHWPSRSWWFINSLGNFSELCNNTSRKSHGSCYF